MTPTKGLGNTAEVNQGHSLWLHLTHLALHFCPHEPTAPGCLAIYTVQGNTTLHLSFSIAESTQRLLLCIPEVHCKPHRKNLIFSQNPSVEGKHQQGKLTLIHTSKGLLCTSSLTTDTAHLTASMTFPVLKRKAGSLLFPIWWSLTLENKPQSTSLTLLHPSILYMLLVLQWIIPFTRISKELQLLVSQKAGLNWRVLV